MPTAQGNHATHDYAERIHERLPRRLQDLREVTWLSMYALWQKCGVSRDTISRIEGGETITGVHVLARLAWGVAETLEGFSAASRISKVVRTAPLCGLSGSNAMNRTEDCADHSQNHTLRPHQTREQLAELLGRDAQSVHLAQYRHPAACDFE